MEGKIMNTHALKANHYDIGRPNYPEAFYDYLYEEVGLNPNSIIADIGAGTGKVARGFLERGSKVFTVEPDQDMMGVLKNNLSHFSNCIPVINTAEDTEIPANSVDLIFCGNSYHWFDRNRVIPEMKRIVKNSQSQYNIVIATLGPCHSIYSDEFDAIVNKYAIPVPGRISNALLPFCQDMFISKSFRYVVYEGFEEFLNGFLSASNSPTPEDSCFNEYCQSVERLFVKYKFNEKIELPFQLSCMIGSVENLI